MRKHSVRKWLHAILDLLPLFVIPVFAIYARNENAQFGYEVTQEVNKAVTIKQIVNYEGNRFYDDETPNYTMSFDNYEGTTFQRIATYNINQEHIYYWKYYFSNELTGRLYSYLNNGTTSQFHNYKVNELNEYRGYLGEIGYSFGTNFYNVTPNTFNGYLSMNIYDLTEMFGNGYEPTLEQCQTYFNSFIEYDVTSTYVIENYKTITYNDTDIGSQMIYTLYNTVHKYFNMNNVFNMGQIWNWVNNTMFGGSAPLSAYIVYQIIAYELIMDIIFLLYSVMMFIVDFAEKGIDRFMGRSC